MPKPAWEDLDEFLDEDDFAVPAIINRQGGGQVPLSVIFDDPYAEAKLADAYVKDDAMPRALCKETLVTAVRRGDSITITFPDGPQTFDIVTTPQPDGTGMAFIELGRP